MSERAETTFILSPAAPPASRTMKFFLRGREMSMCVHGMVGAVAALAANDASLPQHFQIETPLGAIGVEWYATDAGSYVCIDQFTPEFGPAILARDAILAALGADASALDLSVGPVQCVSVSRPKLFVPIVDIATLDGLRPEAALLNAVCSEYQSTGVYAFSCHPRTHDHDVNARQFPAGAELVEDPATGVAAAAFAAYLSAHDFNFGSSSRAQPFSNSNFAVRIAQGDTMGCPCLLEAVAIRRRGQIVKTRVCGLGSVTQ